MIESPDLVSLVTPPSTIIPNTITPVVNNHEDMGRSDTAGVEETVFNDELYSFNDDDDDLLTNNNNNDDDDLLTNDDDITLFIITREK